MIRVIASQEDIKGPLERWGHMYPCKKSPTVDPVHVCCIFRAIVLKYHDPSIFRSSYSVHNRHGTARS